MGAKVIIYNSNSPDSEVEKSISPDAQLINIGRHPASYIHLNSSHISKEHAVILQENETFYLIDKSTNGTTLNKTKLEREKRYRLKDGDIILIAEYRIKFIMEAQVSSPSPRPVASKSVETSTRSAAAAAAVFDIEENDLEDSMQSDLMMPTIPSTFEDMIRSIDPGEEPSYLVFVGGNRDGQRVELRGGTTEIFIGSSPKCQIQLSHQSISPLHAKIRMDWAGITVYDLNAQGGGGIFINGVRINSSRKLHNGDEISFGIPVNMGGVKLLLYDRHSLSSDNLVGLPPPITELNPEKAKEQENDQAVAEKQKPESATVTTNTTNLPPNPASPEIAASTTDVGSATEGEDVEPAGEQKKAGLIDFNREIYAGITVRELVAILFIIIVVIVFSAIALSFF